MAWKSTKTKQPHNIPDPPPPSDPPKTDREPNVISTKIEKETPPEQRAKNFITAAIAELEDVNSDQAIQAIGKLKGALIKLDA